MALPPIIEIVPPTKPVQALITVPGSKSVTNRALILAALAEGRTTLRGALWSEDTRVMVECLQGLGFSVSVQPDPGEPCNRTIAVEGLGGRVPPGGSWTQPKELFVGNAGTAARFLAAFVCLAYGVYRLHGVARMHKRPQAELFAAIRQLGYEVESENHNEKLPAKIRAWALRPTAESNMVAPGRFAGPEPGRCSISIEESSQFASALLLCAQAGGWEVDVLGQNTDESPYVTMTIELIKAFPQNGGEFQIEADASSGSYFLAAEKLLPWVEQVEYSAQFGVDVPKNYLHGVSVANWPSSGWQIDQEFSGVLLNSGLYDGLEFARSWRSAPADNEERKRAMDFLGKSLAGRSVISRQTDLGDSIMTAVVLAPFGLASVRFTDLGRLRVQECERVSALRAELTRCGAKVIEEEDTLTVFPSMLHGGEIETYNDHRMAMCFAILGLKVPGIRIKNPACVKKTFPDFFQKLAALPPDGLGITLLDARNGKPLDANELVAE
jgi:3-phosphoshikimate 1-carboxyvinyltransferase